MKNGSKNNLTYRQKINVELAARAINRKSKKIIKSHTPTTEQESLRIAFNCECADPNCRSRILLTIEEYEKLHQNFARFVVVKGHDEPRIEKVKRSGKKISIVEKYALPKSAA